MKNNDKYVLLEKGRDFTLTSLAEHLNVVYGNKKSGEKYSAIDVQKYVSRGHMPFYLGGNILIERRDETIGIKIIHVSTGVHSSFSSSDSDKQKPAK